MVLAFSSFPHITPVIYFSRRLTYTILASLFDLYNAKRPAN